MNFPQFISFTVTNVCNLRCKMCGQWSEEGYISGKTHETEAHMNMEDWKRVVDEIAAHKIRFILIRGGEPFLYPGIMELVEYINNKGIFLSIDSNGTVLKKHARDLAQLKDIHITFSVDGPEEIHDQVRGVKGSFRKTRDNIVHFHELLKEYNSKISTSICFTISPYSYKGLGIMPDVARDMGISSMNIVPYYYFSDRVGRQYEKELRNHLGYQVFSWHGFHHEESGIDIAVFKSELKKYIANLKEIENFPYMPFNEEDYEEWFSNDMSTIGSTKCHNVEELIDIQPDGSANFCVDFPDYTFGNVMQSSIGEIWESPEAEKFRTYRRQKPLSICYRCGAKYISELKE